MKRLTLMSMVVVAGLLVALAIAVVPQKWEMPRGMVSNAEERPPDAVLMRMCQVYRHTDPKWWKEFCKI